MGEFVSSHLLTRSVLDAGTEANVFLVSTRVASLHTTTTTMHRRYSQVLQMAVRKVPLAESEGYSYRGSSGDRQSLLGHEWNHS